MRNTNVVASLREALKNNDMGKLNAIANMAQGEDTAGKKLPVYEGILLEGEQLPDTKMLLLAGYRKAIAKRHAEMLGVLMAGLRDITTENVLNASVFKGLFQSKVIAQLKKGRTSDELWTAVGERILDADESIRQALPAWAGRVLYLQVGKEGYESLASVPFWKFGRLLRQAIESGNEEALAKIFAAVNRKTQGGLHECHWEGTVCFFDVDEQYEESIYQILKSVGVSNADKLNIEELWEQVDEKKMSMALTRFILQHKEFWKNITSHLLEHCREHGGYEVITQCISDIERS